MNLKIYWRLRQNSLSLVRRTSSARKKSTSTKKAGNLAAILIVVGKLLLPTSRFSYSS